MPVQIFEGRQLLGTSESERLMVAEGRHVVDLVNDEVGFRPTRTVDVAGGRVSTIAIDAPKGVLALNAQPWAQVSLDGQAVGETPIGDLAVPVGRHEVVFHHPDLGDRRHAVMVTLRDVARLSVDMRTR